MLYIISAIIKYVKSLKCYINISIFCNSSFKLTTVKNWGDWRLAELYWSNLEMRISLLLVWFVWFLSTFAFLCSRINHMRKITPFTLKCRFLQGDSIEIHRSLQDITYSIRVGVCPVLTVQSIWSCLDQVHISLVVLSVCSRVPSLRQLLSICIELHDCVLASNLICFLFYNLSAHFVFQ